MHEVLELTQLLNRKEKLVAMLAPSFPIVYKVAPIIAMLKAMGFSYVVEVTAGAKKTNDAVLKVLQEDPSSRFITSPCPSFVRFVRTKHPDFIPYLAFQADSPMVATTKIVNEKYPGYRPVFIGPCNVKRLEASQDYPELKILVLTYKELNTVITTMNKTIPSEVHDTFDISENTTKIYPFDGGLTESSGVRNILKDEEIRIVSGWRNCEAALQEFKTNKKIRLLDILFCEGGCINGPGIVSPLNLEERKQVIMNYSTMAKLRTYA